METTEHRTAWTYEEDNGAAIPPRVIDLMTHFGSEFGLLQQPLKFTTSRRVFGRWLGRRIPSSYGGAYVYLTHIKTHAILINLERIDHTKPKSLEIVIAEELLHMRDWVDGDRRRHAKHGHDRIAHRVAHATGSSLDDVRNALIPVQPREYRYLYQCPNCGHNVPRKRTGKWACRPCFEATGRRIPLVIAAHVDPDTNTRAKVQ